MKKLETQSLNYYVLFPWYLLLFPIIRYGGKETYRYKYLIYQPLGQIGVCVFVFISDYFLSSRVLNAKDGWQRAKKLWIKTLIYSWLIFVVVISITGLKNLSIAKILIAIFLVVFGEYWFITNL